jgi:hypothetical protein
LLERPGKLKLKVDMCLELIRTERCTDEYLNRACVFLSGCFTIFHEIRNPELFKLRGRSPEYTVLFVHHWHSQHGGRNSTTPE